jgi:hypothetical protein
VKRDTVIKIVRDEWLAIHFNLSEEARALKRQQWLVVFYCSLLFAGIVGFMHIQGFANLGEGERWIMRVLSASVLAAGVFFLSLLQWNLRNLRKQIGNIENRFLVRRRYGLRLNGWERMLQRESPKFLFQFPYYILFMLAVLSGFLFVHWYLRSAFLLTMYIRFIPQ